jgi:hypothetical protein
MRFYKYIEETTVTGDVVKNLAKGHVDVVGAPKYKKKKKKTRLDRRPIVVHEASVSSAVVGSRQTRVVGDDHEITVLKRQPRPLKFDKLLGAYLPLIEDDVDEDFFDIGGFSDAPIVLGQSKRKKKLIDVPKEFWDDPLYKNVLTAKNKKKFDKALDTLKKIRGSNAVMALKKAIGKK